MTRLSLIRLIFALAAISCREGSAQQMYEPGVAEAKGDGPVPEWPKVWSHPKVEARGIWIARNNMEPATRPAGSRETIDEAKARLVKTLDQLKAANFNIVLLDAWFQGYVAYPGSKIAPQWPAFQGE